MTELYQAKYMLSLIDNVIDEDVRAKLVESLSHATQGDYDDVFVELFRTIINNYGDGKTYNTELAKSTIESEFISLGLNNIYGDYAELKDLINLSIDAYHQTNLTFENHAELYNSFINVADNMSNTYKNAVYYTVLKYLVRNNKLLNNVDLTRQIISYLDTQDTAGVSESCLYRILFPVFASVRIMS